MSDDRTQTTDPRTQAKAALEGADNWLVWAQRLAPALTTADYDMHTRIAAALILAHEGFEP